MAALPPNQHLAQIWDEEDLLLAAGLLTTIMNAVSKGLLEGDEGGHQGQFG